MVKTPPKFWNMIEYYQKYETQGRRHCTCTYPPHLHSETRLSIVFQITGLDHCETWKPETSNNLKCIIQLTENTLEFQLEVNNPENRRKSKNSGLGATIPAPIPLI